jgi:hypothetical protein
MVPLENKLESLFDIWSLYASYINASLPREQAYTKLAQAKTAIMRYTLPQWGLTPPQGNKLTAWEIEQAFELMQRIKPEQLQSALLVQHQLFEEQQVPERIRRTYRAALNQLLAWCQEQAWFSSELATEPQTLKPPKKVRRSAQDLRKPRDNPREERNQPFSGYKYALGSVKGDTVNPQLQRELDDFAAFRLQPDLPTFQAVRPRTVERELASIRQLLGWLYRVKEYSIELLSLNQIIPYVDKASPEQTEQVGQEVRALADEYMRWRRSRQKDELEKFLTSNPDTSTFSTFLSVAKFVYRKEISLAAESHLREDRQELPLITKLKASLKAWTLKQPKKKPKRSRPEENSLKPELTGEPELTGWTEILAIVEQLRAECQPRLLLENQTRKKAMSFGPLRSLSAIAQSYQRFLLFALMSYLPPARQQTYRNLLAVNAQPSSIKEASSACYQQGKHWYLRFLDSKPGSEHLIKIPNLQYPGGRCFYQYLQEWLDEYSYEAANGDRTKINGLRQVLQPHHPYFFTKKTGEKYLHAPELSHLVRDMAYRLTKKSLTPDTFRALFLKSIKQAAVEKPPPSFKALRSQIADKYLDIYGSQYPDALKAAVWFAGEMAQKYVNATSSFC